LISIVLNWDGSPDQSAMRLCASRSRSASVSCEVVNQGEPKLNRAWLLCFVAPLFALSSFGQMDDAATRQLAHDLFKQLIEINTTDSVGSVTAASEAMAQRFREAGFPDSDIQVLGPNDRKKNLVVRLHGSGKHKPILLIGHLDVVEARREDWTTDPFQFV